MSKELEEKELEKTNGAGDSYYFKFRFYEKNGAFDGWVQQGGFSSFWAAIEGKGKAQDEKRAFFSNYEIKFSNEEVEKGDVPFANPFGLK